MLTQIERDELCYLSAAEVIARYRAGSLLPSILINALIKRIEELNPAINALADTYFDEALEQAAAADILYVEGRADGAMVGFPILVKDAQRVAGKRTTFGSLLYMDAGPKNRSDEGPEVNGQR